MCMKEAAKVMKGNGGVCVPLLRLLNNAKFEGGHYWAEEGIRGCQV